MQAKLAGEMRVVSRVSSQQQGTAEKVAEVARWNLTWEVLTGMTMLSLQKRPINF